MYVYINDGRGGFAVGHYMPISFGGQGQGYSTCYEFFIESNHTSTRDAAARVSYLNGGSGALQG